MAKIKIRKAKTPITKFSGSLVQQNHGEELEKGYLLWDIEDKDKHICEFRRIENDYGYFTIRADGGILPDLKLPPKCRMRVIWPVSASEISKTEIIKLNSIIQKKYKPFSLNLLFKPSTNENSTEIEFDGMINVKNFNVQQDLLQKWCKLEGLPAQVCKELNKLDKRVYDTVVNSEMEDFANSTWKLNYVSLENFMSYGELTEINFKKTPGIVGLFGNNAVGKSVIIDAIIYALFNKVTRQVKNEELINKYTDSNMCRVCLELTIRGVGYRFERWTTKVYHKRSGNYIYARTDINLMRETEDGWENLNEHQRTETEKLIRNAIGSYEDFITTTLSSQNGTSEFINQRPALRADNMLRILGLDIFTKKYDAVKDMIKNLEYEIKSYDYDNILESLDSKKELLIEDTKKYDAANAENKETINSISKIRTKIGDLQSRLKTDITIKESLSELQTAVIVLEEKLDKLKKDKISIKIKHDELLIKIESIEDKFIHDEDTINQLIEKSEIAQKIQKRIDELVIKINTHKKVLEVYRIDLKQENGCPVSYDDNHLGCGYLTGYIEKTDKCNRLITEFKRIISDRNELIIRLKDFEEAEAILETQRMIRGKLQIANEKLTTIDTLAISIDNDIEVKCVSLRLAKSKYDMGKLQKEAIESNIFLNGEIELSETALDEFLIIEENQRIEISKYNQNVILVTRDIDDIEQRLERIEEIEDERAIYKLYTDAMHRDGIPVSVLKQYIPKMNYQINKILSNIVPFGVYLVIEEDSTNIDIVMRYDGIIDNTRPASMASGMEKLLINFSIRYALIAISNLNKSSFWIIDEGFGVLSPENLPIVKDFFLNTQDIFENIIMITHIDELKDVVNWTYDIEKNNGISIVSKPEKN